MIIAVNTSHQNSFLPEPELREFISKAPVDTRAFCNIYEKRRKYITYAH